ncbi:hypothetical protein [Pseudomonas sp. L13]|uniref:hypothetical protein n=1 Tax=Pseudomonas sp. L13 TaxID=343985 RepID=UPI001379498E|nr:hypothetical protein [Pseudomonas sp. L13]NCE90362.1 hypothetical protein [Pseudomonas sp. L13]
MPTDPIIPPDKIPQPLPTGQRVHVDLDEPYSRFSEVDMSPFPDEPYDYGLGIRQVVPHLTMLFERWATFNQFDEYYLDTDRDTLPLAGDSVISTTEARYPLHVPDHQVPRGEVFIKGRVVRVGSGTPSESPGQFVYIKTTRPGGVSKDPEPGLPGWHDGLTMEVEGFAEGASIKPADITSGLWCDIHAYLHMRRNDLIDLHWDGNEVKQRVTQADVDAGEVKVHVPKDVIEKGSLKGPITIRYRVIDFVENISGGEKYQFSRPYHLISELDPNLRSAPEFLINGTTALQVDFDKDHASQFSVKAQPDVIPPPIPAPPHLVTVTLRATLADGTTKSFVLDSVEDPNIGETITSVPAEIIFEIVGGSFNASYEWHDSAGKTLGQSASIMIAVVGTPVRMPPLTIEPIELGLIDPDRDCVAHIPDYIPYAFDLWETLVIEEVVAGGGGAYYEQGELAGAPGGTRLISQAVLQQFRGRSNVVAYYLVDDGKAKKPPGHGVLTVRKSVELGIQVGARNPTMPAARLEGSIGNNISPEHVIGPEVRVILPYTGTQDKDALHYTILGSKPDASLRGTININPGTAGKELPLPVTREVVDLNNGGTLTITYSLLRKGPPEQVLRSEVLKLTVGAGINLVRPVIRGASVFPDQLNPLAALNGTQVIIKFPMRDNEDIFLDWLTADGTGSTTVEVKGNATTQEVEAPIPERIIAEGIREANHRINVLYRFLRDGIDYKSETVPLVLLTLTGLPNTFIEGIGDVPELQLSRLTAGARTLTPAWHFIHPDCIIWQDFYGIDINGLPFHASTYPGERLGEEGALIGLNRRAPVEQLRLLMDGSTLTIQVWVALSGVPDIARAIPLPTKTYTVRATYFSDLTDFFNYDRNGWENTLNGRGELAVEGAENICWRASKTAGETVQPGLHKTYLDLKANTRYEVSFYCKVSGTTSITTARLELGAMSATRSVEPNRNWAKVSHVFTTPAAPPMQNLTARLSLSVGTAATFMVDQIVVQETSLVT